MGQVILVTLIERIDAPLARSVDRTAGDPQEVSDLIVRLLTTRRPQLRYPLGPGSALRGAAQRLLPQRALEGIVKLVVSRARPAGRR